MAFSRDTSARYRLGFCAFRGFIGTLCRRGDTIRHKPRYDVSTPLCRIGICRSARGGTKAWYRTATTIPAYIHSIDDPNPIAILRLVANTATFAGAFDNLYQLTVRHW